MRRNFTWTSLVIGGVVAGLLANACSSDKKAPAPSDGGTGGTAGTGTGGAGTGGAGTGGTVNNGGSGGVGGGAAGAAGAPTDGGDAGAVALSACTGVTGVTDSVSCGEYIVQHIDACADCHSPQGAQGIDYSKALQGNPSFADLDGIPGNGTGNVPTPNLTLLKTEGWTKADIKDAILNGKRSAARNGGIFPIMPYFVFHNMSDSDANAVVDYIFQLTPIGNEMTDREPLPTPISLLPLPIAPFDPKTLPDTSLPKTDPNYEKAVLGKYMSSEVGICVECHSERVPQTQALDVTKLFAGGESFFIGGPFGTVTSLNITPDQSGIKGWTAANVQATILTGKDKAGMSLCPPMPFGPLGAFGGMDPAQALAIGYYLTTIPGVKNGLADGGTFPMCVPPSGPPPGGPDAGDAGH